MLLARRRVLLLRLVDGAAQRHHQSRPRHLQHVEARLASRRLEVRTSRTTELQNLQVGIDEYGGWRELIDGTRSASRWALSSPLKPSAAPWSACCGRGPRFCRERL